MLEEACTPLRRILSVSAPGDDDVLGVRAIGIPDFEYLLVVAALHIGGVTTFQLVLYPTPDAYLGVLSLLPTVSGMVEEKVQRGTVLPDVFEFCFHGLCAGFFLS